VHDENQVQAISWNQSVIASFLRQNNNTLLVTMSGTTARNPKDTAGLGGRNNIIILLLLTSILAHGILFSSSSIKPLAQQTLRSRKVNDEINNDIVNDHQQFLPHQEEQTQNQEQLPHWRLATDCSSYSFDCFVVAQRENKYKPYPFTLSFRKEIEGFDKNENQTATRLRDEWSVESFDVLPDDWIEYLEKKDSESSVVNRNYLHPPTVPQDEYQRCLDLAIHQNKSSIEQLDVLLHGESPQIVPEPDTNMVAFTISDYGYVHDMLHDVFQMMDDVVGFSPKHFFLVAIDRQSAEMACKYGYSVVLWKADEGNLRDAVANTKVILSHALVKQGIDFFFTEMDVWWIRSPKLNLVDFQNRHKRDDGERKHIYFSGHQNNFNAPNIGVYAVKADRYTEEYFRVCLDVLKEKPETHDQHVLQEVHRLFEHTYDDRPYVFGGAFKPDGPPDTPQIQNPFKAMYFSPHEVVADERPMTTQQTLAIHTLNGMPLQAPHGKKMVAKELGVYYGFHSQPRATADTNTAAAGYYDRSGENRRYIWLDSDIRNNFYSIAHEDRYHDRHVLEWTIAIMIAIARKTDRILVLPQVFDSDMDAGTYFTWTMMDYSKVTEMVDFRETNFLSNPKAWRNPGNSDNVEYWPFESVLNTALFRAVDKEETISIYNQVTNRSSIVSKKAWSSSLHRHEWLDAWVGSLSSVPELDSAEVLLVNPDFFMERGNSWTFASRLMDYKKSTSEQADPDALPPPVGKMEREVLAIYDKLGWCWPTAFRHTANKVSASDSCYEIGNPRQYFR
jgi:hypothetical protein